MWSTSRKPTEGERWTAELHEPWRVVPGQRECSRSTGRGFLRRVCGHSKGLPEECCVSKKLLGEHPIGTFNMKRKPSQRDEMNLRGSIQLGLRPHVRSDKKKTLRKITLSKHDPSETKKKRSHKIVQLSLNRSVSFQIRYLMKFSSGGGVKTVSLSNQIKGPMFI